VQLPRRLRDAGGAQVGIGQIVNDGQAGYEKEEQGNQNDENGVNVSADVEKHT
jgi:hypothetical protein